MKSMFIACASFWLENSLQLVVPGTLDWSNLRVFFCGDGAKKRNRLFYLLEI